MGKESNSRSLALQSDLHLKPDRLQTAPLPYILMDFPIHINTISMGLPILYFKGEGNPDDHYDLYERS